MANDKEIETGTEFKPKFDMNGLITAIAQESTTGDILMVAYMNSEALDITIKTGIATYYSRSRQELWKKGQESGHIQRVERILVDCDQDSLILKVKVDAGQCHVGYNSCFYRALEKDSDKKLEFIADKIFDPKTTYKRQ